MDISENNIANDQKNNKEKSFWETLMEIFRKLKIFVLCAIEWFN